MDYLFLYPFENTFKIKYVFIYLYILVIPFPNVTNSLKLAEKQTKLIYILNILLLFVFLN